LNHFASPAYWDCYHKLPSEVRALADVAFERLKNDPRHPSLHFKKSVIFGRHAWVFTIVRLHAIQIEA